MSPLPRGWLDVARSAFFEELYRGRSVLCVGVGDGRAIEVLLERGAAQVVGVDTDGEAVAAAQQRLAGRAEVKLSPVSAVMGRYDVIFVALGEALATKPGAIGAVLDHLAPGGWLIAAARSREGTEARPGRVEGVGYYDLLDRLAPHFPSVTMMGEAPLAGATLATYGDEQAEPVLDAGLAGAAQAELIVAVAGPRRPQLGYGLIVLPPEASVATPSSAATRAGVDALRAALASRDQKLGKLEVEVREREGELSRLRALVTERDQQLARRDLDRGALEAACGEASAERDRLVALLAERDQQAARREADRKALEAACAEASAERARLAALLAERDRKATRHEADRKALEATVAERDRQATRRETDRKALEAACGEASAERDRLAALLAERDARIARLDEETRRVARDLSARGERLARAEAEERALRGKLAARDEALAGAETKRKALEAELVRARREVETLPQADWAALLQARERGMDELRALASTHAEEMRAAQARLDERDAYIDELEEAARAGTTEREAAAEAVRRAEEAEARERAARLRVAELEGALLRLEGAGGARPGAEGAPATELERKVAELEERNAKMQARVEDAQREAWAQVRARSEAEAQAAEVREDTVRKLKDARKIANVELMRAMEEATRKAVSLKEELSRSEGERREAVAALRVARESEARLGEELGRLRGEPASEPRTEPLGGPVPDLDFSPEGIGAQPESDETPPPPEDAAGEEPR